DLTVAPQVHRRHPRHLARLVAEPVVGALAQCPAPSVAPALDAAIVEERAGVGVAGRHGASRVAVAEVDGPQPSHVARRAAPRCSIAVPEPAVVSGAPALDPTVVQDGARVELTGRDGAGRPTGAEVDGTERRHLTGLVAEVAGGVLAELAELVHAPALHGVVVEQGARVATASRHGERRSPPAQEDRAERGHLPRLVAQVLDVPP